MCGYLVLVAFLAALNAALFVCLALVLGVTALEALAAVAVWSGVVTFIVLLFMRGAKGV